ncbi:hypothetical protein JN531_016980 (plasmid) [Flagellatimonas centrodinii]|uniref:hypothetical protein n=1 Tax=Flagellatimonas centrodinii TaxID=2806210 RepID=UPI001FED66F2|nr:hypothetical protein [Flagellatimonas centrodinii]ULQ48327.1 hypothetical protein JN531_016980 [Flagellatimonas centrodinii]
MALADTLIGSQLQMLQQPWDCWWWVSVLGFWGWLSIALASTILAITQLPAGPIGAIAGSFTPLRAMASEQSFLERLRDWDLDLWDIWDWAMRLARYYIETFGFWGYLGVGVAAVLILLSFDLTHSLTSQIISGTYKILMIAVLAVVAKLLQLLASATASTAIARARDAARFYESRYRREEPVEPE